VHTVDGPATGIGSNGGEERALGNAVAHFLASMCRRARLPCVPVQHCESWDAVGLSPIAHEEAGSKEHIHCGEDSPAWLASRSSAERVREARADDEDRKDLKEVRKRSWVLIRMGAVALKNPPPFVPSILMASCEATAPGRWSAKRLRRCARWCRMEILRNSLPNQKQCVNNASRREI